MILPPQGVHGNIIAPSISTHIYIMPRLFLVCGAALFVHAREDRRPSRGKSVYGNIASHLKGGEQNSSRYPYETRLDSAETPAYGSIPALLGREVNGHMASCGSIALS